MMLLMPQTADQYRRAAEEAKQLAEKATDTWERENAPKVRSHSKVVTSPRLSGAVLTGDDHSCDASV